MFFLFPDGTAHMVNYHQWVTRQHAGTRESHHFPDLFPHFWFVTMNLTITAKRLGLHKWTAVRAKMSIGEKLSLIHI